MDECLTLAEFERYARNELDLCDTDRVERHIAVCARCKTAHESFVTDNRFLDNVKSALGPAPEQPKSGQDETVAQTERSPGSGTYRERFPVIAGYKIKRIVGRGGMGVVYEAVQEKLSRRVALKLLPAIVSSARPELITRFRREAAAAAKLHHTNIIPIYDFGESSDGYYYAMELIEGLPLNVVIKRLVAMEMPTASTGSLAAILTQPSTSLGPEDYLESAGKTTTGPGAREIVDLSTDSGITTGGSTGGQSRAYYRQIARWMAEVAQALHYAHLNGMIHRDIKPGNIMLCRDGRMMILDFGLVKTVGEESVTATGSLVGTYRYMSPEQIGAKRITVDARCDVYSLGATMYELLAFQPAFPALEQSELLSLILFKEPVAPRKIVASVPVDLQTICLKAMEKFPGERYQTARALAEDLNFYLQDQAIVARPQGIVRRTMKLVRRRRVETIAITALVLLAAATYVAYGAFQSVKRANRDKLMLRAIAAWQSGDYDGAQQAFSDVLAKDSTDYSALVNLANVKKDSFYATGDPGQLENAENLLERAVNQRPEGRDVWNAKGVLYKALNRPADAIDAYQRILRLDKEYYPAWVNMGMVYATDKDMLNAEKCLIEGTTLKEGAENSMPWRVLAALQLHLGRSEALESLLNAKTFSDSPDVATNVLFALHYLSLNTTEDTEQALNYAITADLNIKDEEEKPLEGQRASHNWIRVKRVLALARLRNRMWKSAGDAARAAIDAGDQPCFAELIMAVASAELGQEEEARQHLAAAETVCPEELEESEYSVIEDGKTLWFDHAKELESLREQALARLEGS